MPAQHRPREQGPLLQPKISSRGEDGTQVWYAMEPQQRGGHSRDRLIMSGMRQGMHW